MTDAKHRLASLHDSRETFFKALKAHEQSIYKLGYDEGFGAGWEAAIKRLAELRPIGAGSPTQGNLSALLQPEDTDVPAHETLIRIVSNTPGLQRHEIVEIARKQLLSVSERGVRTALQRMKNSGELRVTDNKWYVADRHKASAAAEGEDAILE